MILRQMIHTRRLIVRPFRSEDGEDLYDYLSDPVVYVYEPGEPLSRVQAATMAADLSASPDFWAVELAVEQRVIGQIYFSQVEPRHLLTWELGYILSPRYQRQGYATEAASALLRHGFDTAPIHRITAQCNPQNEASWRLLEKLGFRREGYLIQNNFFRRDAAGNPIWIDTYVYGLLRSEALET